MKATRIIKERERERRGVCLRKENQAGTVENKKREKEDDSDEDNRRTKAKHL